MKKFLTLFMIFIASASFGFAAGPVMPNEASVQFKYTVKSESAIKTIAGFYPEQVRTYENLITEPPQATVLTYGTDFGGASGKALYAAVGTNWAKAEAATPGTANPTINVTLTMHPFKQDNVLNWKGYTVKYREAARTGAKAAPADKVTVTPASGVPVVVGNKISVGAAADEDCTADHTVTITCGVGAFLTNDTATPSEQGFLELEFTDMELLTPPDLPVYDPTTFIEGPEENYTATWTFSVVII